MKVKGPLYCFRFCTYQPVKYSKVNNRISLNKHGTFKCGSCKKKIKPALFFSQVLRRNQNELTASTSYSDYIESIGTKDSMPTSNSPDMVLESIPEESRAVIFSSPQSVVEPPKFTAYNFMLRSTQSIASSPPGQNLKVQGYLGGMQATGLFAVGHQISIQQAYFLANRIKVERQKLHHFHMTLIQ
ncbi:hypothetical protein AYI69_g8344 [Smittium culicis]|uniref:Uncharacterized protein n=1 Tax=Smittium culicis TaxID=133412 RepID=A0A1R1XKB4_9FUNG|nr:hypothetical protein AYI69_g8344 [Smittium culicis]